MVLTLKRPSNRSFILPTTLGLNYSSKIWRRTRLIKKVSQLTINGKCIDRRPSRNLICKPVFIGLCLGQSERRSAMPELILFERLHNNQRCVGRVNETQRKVRFAFDVSCVASMAFHVQHAPTKDRFPP